MIKEPVVSVVTPSYNQADFLENTILSVLEQDYPNLEYIIMDGGSTDRSVEIIRKYAKYLKYWQSQPDGGQVLAINTGFQKASGEIFAFLNSDDFYLQGAVNHIVQLYHQNPQAVGWVGGSYAIVPDGFIIQATSPRKLSRDEIADWADNYFSQPACFFSANAAFNVGLFNPKFNYAFDFDFFMRIVELGVLIPTQRFLSATMVHMDAKTQKHKAQMMVETQVIQRSYGYESFALAQQDYIDQASKQSQVNLLAKLIYDTQMKKRRHPNQFIRFPGKLTEN